MHNGSESAGRCNKVPSGYRTGVSLHGHTCHSRESLRFLYRLGQRSLPLRLLLKDGENRYESKHGTRLDMHKAWWTPPIGVEQAWNLERAQIEQLGLFHLISLTDHDCLEAAFQLRDVAECREVPISFEWTVLYGGSELHIGIHNLPMRIAAEIACVVPDSNDMSGRGDVSSFLEFLAAQPETLVVLNHPLWDESGVGHERHLDAVRLLLQTSGEFIHALEWNGLRSRKENLQVIGLARAWSKPVISGGDRHTWEANSVLNLTNAREFAEFASEIRQGHSVVMLTETYFQPRALRMLRMIADVLAIQPDHPEGWLRWSDRVFYLGESSGPAKSLSVLCGEKQPNTLQMVSTVAKRLPIDQMQRLLAFTSAGCEPVLISDLVAR